jgi:hypothetical protein
MWVEKRCRQKNVSPVGTGYDVFRCCTIIYIAPTAQRGSGGHLFLPTGYAYGIIGC